MLKCLLGICGGNAPAGPGGATNRRPLLREVTGLLHKSSHEILPRLVQQKSGLVVANATPLKRGFTHVDQQDEALAAMVAEIMLEYGWKGVDKGSITVEDKSGEGGSKTYRVTAKGYIPEVVALHSRSEEVVGDPLSEPRMEAAQLLFAKGDLAPSRIVEGGDWFIEVWEGNGAPKMASDEQYAQVGSFLARIHSLPAEWYDDWREKLIAAHPYLGVCKKGSMAWWYAARPKEWLDKMPPDERSMFLSDFYAVESTPGKRLVTTHGDLHMLNMITIGEGSLKAIDFEFSCVSAAITDISYCLGWMSRGWHIEVPGDISQKKRIFLKSYLEAMGDPCGPDDVESLLVDGELQSFFHHFGPCTPLAMLEGEEGVGDWTRKFQIWKGIVDKCQGKSSSALAYLEDDETKEMVMSVDHVLSRETILEGGSLKIEQAFNNYINLKEGRLCLVGRDSPDRCVFEFAQQLRGMNMWLPLTLTSHPGMAVVSGAAEGPFEDRGRKIFGEDVGIGSIPDALSVKLDEAGFIHTSCTDPHRVLDIDDLMIQPLTPIVIWDDGLSFVPPEEECQGQKFKVNENGTISPTKGEHLVLGAGKKIMKNVKTSGRLILVPNDSPHRCIFEFADKLRNSEEKIPLILSSHPNMAIAKGPKHGPFNHVGYDVFHEELGVGPISEAIAVKRDGKFLCEGTDGNARRVLDIESWSISGGVPLGIFNDGPSFKPPEMDAKGQLFRINQDGTISPADSEELVLGAYSVLYDFK